MEKAALKASSPFHFNTEKRDEAPVNQAFTQVT
jgi:hypothetical protein